MFRQNIKKKLFLLNTHSIHYHKNALLDTHMPQQKIMNTKFNYTVPNQQNILQTNYNNKFVNYLIGDDYMTHRLCTGGIVFGNAAPIYLMSASYVQPQFDLLCLSSIVGGVCGSMLTMIPLIIYTTFHTIFSIPLKNFLKIFYGLLCIVPMTGYYVYTYYDFSKCGLVNIIKNYTISFSRGEYLGLKRP